MGREKLTKITGTTPHEMYSISKMMWLKKHRPDLLLQRSPA
ncbi:MAG: hypothetical protein IJ123_08570 [Blautia sp.]|nr:hypothetical protein [Blautia sp.]